MSARGRYLRVCAFALIIAYFLHGLSIADEFSIEELNPAMLLAVDSAQIGGESNSLNIQMPVHAGPVNLEAPQPGDSLSANLASTVKEAPHTNSFANSTEASAQQLESELRKSRISPLDSSSADDKSEDLKRLISQINSVRFQSQETAEAIASDTSEPEPGIAPDEPAPLSDATPTQSETSTKSMSDETLQMVRQAVIEPNRVAEPLQLAEVLFQSGQPRAAGLCYKQALVSIPADDPNMAGERAWILFQIGNCLKHDDPNTARESYAELLRVHPDSPWAQIAKARHSVIDWYQKDQPGKLIRELNH